MSAAARMPGEAAPPTRWAIVGTGAVAQNFAAVLAGSNQAKAVAVASSGREKAQRFAARFGIPHALDSVEEAAALPEIDAVYLASATHLHAAHGHAVLAAGKALLCEKPFTGSAAEAAEVIGMARQRNLFAMEAMWTRFNGVVRRLKAELERGVLGEPSGAVFSLGYGKTLSGTDAANPDRSNIRNFGCYALSLATHFFGPVTDWKATGRRNAAGVDTDLALVLSHGRVTSLIDVSSTATRANRLDVYGTEAVATIPAALVNPAVLEIRPQGSGGVAALVRDTLAPLRTRLPAARRMQQSGIAGEIEEVRRCLGEGRTESTVMPLDETLAVQKLMDEISASF